MSTFRLLICFQLSVLAGCVSGTTSGLGDSAIIKTTDERYVDALKTNDIDTIVSFYAEDAVLMPPDSPPATGHAAIKDYLVRENARAHGAGTHNVDVASDAGVSAKLGWHAGTYKVYDALGLVVGSGKYTEVWKKVGSRWVIMRDCWNSDGPTTVAAAPLPKK